MERRESGALPFCDFAPQAEHDCETNQEGDWATTGHVREAGRFKQELCNEVINKGKVEAAGLSPAEWDEDGVSDNVAMRYNSLVLLGKLRAAVRMATGRGLGGPLGPYDKCTKTGAKVIEVHSSKYPSITRPEALHDGGVPGFEKYPECLVGTSHSSCGESVSLAANKIQGAAEPSGVDALHLQSWINHQGTASENLSNELAIWCEWLANESPPYAAYRAFNYKRSVALDKQPGVRPLAIGEVWMRMWAKDVIAEAGNEAKVLCGSTQLCSGLEAGVEGGLHAAREALHDDGWLIVGSQLTTHLNAPS